ncbi:hypothetical protein D8674_012737 [Pyrus ussuriensis x Pyrus communis]|uniref:Transmembrane protein n=1 Tax=Pyrus ussuriensis x Pyrus communis TaxID=2448454 RepID=A0A5N5GNL4_9ROSA|nr:hypothetical protein D8674_012737 [Pyrus ussuriensis x Pyrus communis]
MDMTKGSISTDECLRHSKSLANSLLTSINMLILNILSMPSFVVLAPNILCFVLPSFRHAPPLPTYYDLRPRFLAFEAQDPHLNNPSHFSHIAFYTTYPNPPPQNNGPRPPFSTHQYL